MFPVAPVTNTRMSKLSGFEDYAARFSRAWANRRRAKASRLSLETNVGQRAILVK
jgi:hypothetical protein